MIRHDDEFVEQETAALAVVREHIDKKRSHTLGLEEARRPQVFVVTKKVRTDCGARPGMFRQR